MKHSQKKLKYGSFSILISVALVLIALGINLLVSLLPSRVLHIDLTDLKLSALSDTTEEFVSSLQEDITIVHVCITGEEEQTITDMIKKYDEASDKIRVESVDPAVRPAFISKYTDQSLENNSLIVISGKRAKVIDYYNMFTFDLYYTDASGNSIPQGEMSYSDFQAFYQYYSDYFGSYYTYDTLFAGEAVTTSAIDYVTTENLPKAYTVTGHGEAAFTDTLISGLELDNIDISELSIVASGIPDDADCLIINAPVTDLSEIESKQLENYLKKGGNLLLITDPEHLDLKNLFAVTEGYGLKAESGYVCESKNYLGQTYMVMPDVSVASSTLGISGYAVVAPLAHPITYTKVENTAYLEMFKTSAEAYLSKEISDGENEGQDDLEKASYLLGVLTTTSTENGKTSHIMWISSSSLATDEINTYSTGGNYLYLITLMEKMTGKSSSLSIASKAFVEPSLVINFAQVCFWTAVFCVIIPLSLLTICFCINRKRRKR